MCLRRPWQGLVFLQEQARCRQDDGCFRVPRLGLWRRRRQPSRREEEVDRLAMFSSIRYRLPPLSTFVLFSTSVLSLFSFLGHTSLLQRVLWAIFRSFGRASVPLTSANVHASHSFYKDFNGGGDRERKSGAQTSSHRAANATRQRIRNSGRRLRVLCLLTSRGKDAADKS